MRLLRRALPQLRTTATSSPASSSSPGKGGRSLLSSHFTYPEASATIDGSIRSNFNDSNIHPTHFNHRSLWPRGTWDDPVPITSTTDERVVACTGVSPRGNSTSMHPTRWLTVQKGQPCQCPDCAQVFKLERRAHNAVGDGKVDMNVDVDIGVDIDVGIKNIIKHRSST